MVLAGIVNVVVTGPPGLQEAVPSISMASKNTWQGAFMALTVTVTRVPGGPCRGSIDKATAEAGDADHIVIEHTRKATTSRDSRLPPACARLPVLI